MVGGVEFMTKEQKEMVEKNHNLIYYFLYKKKLDIEENYDIYAIVLCRCVQFYKEDKSRFSTYALRCFEREYMRQLDYGRRCGRDKAIVSSLEFEIADKDSENPSLLYDVVENVSSPDPYGLGNVEYDLSILTEIEVKVCYLRYLGYKMREIGDIVGYSGAQVSRIIKRSCEKLGRGR